MPVVAYTYLEAEDLHPPAFEVVVFPSSDYLPRHYRLRHLSVSANAVFYHPQRFTNYVDAITAGREWIGAI